MTADPVRQVLFVQGGGAGTYDEWDHVLAADLRRRLGDGAEVRYPRMPDEDDPGLVTWGTAIRRELAALDDGAVAVGHSVGGTILAATLAAVPPPHGLAGLVLVAAPFVGAGGWPDEELDLTGLGARLPPGLRVDVVHGLADETVPPSHADLWARAVPGAHVHRLPGRDHQLDGDLSEVARVVVEA